MKRSLRVLGLSASAVGVSCFLSVMRAQFFVFQEYSSAIAESTSSLFEDNAKIIKSWTQEDDVLPLVVGEEEGRPFEETTKYATTTISLKVNSTASLSSCSIYFHLHFQKTGGTALAAALSTSSLVKQCNKSRKFQPGSCESELQAQHCPAAATAVVGPNGGDNKKTEKTNNDGRLFLRLFSRITTGWNCGVHASLHDIRQCRAREFHYLQAKNNLRIVALVRDPLDRYVSEYVHCASHGVGVPNATTDLPQLFESGNPNVTQCWTYEFDDRGVPGLSEFVDLGGNHESVNRQTKMLSGCPMRSTATGAASNNANWSDPIVMQRCLEMAKKNVESLFFVGIAEEFDRSLEVLSRLTDGELGVMISPKENVHDLNLSRQNRSSHVHDSNNNTSKYAGLLSNGLRARIMEQEKHDFELYRHAHQIFEERYGRGT